MNIYVNQLGYMAKGRKRAVLALDAQAFSAEKDITVFIIGQNREHCVFRKNAVFAGIDKASSDAVWQVDFTEFTVKGRYRLAASGVFSASFEISDDLYKNLLTPLAKTYYYQRCGMELEEKYAGIFKRKCCHREKALLLEDYQKKQSGMNPEPVQSYDVTGGWHDAGDYGRYTTPAATATAHLLYAWKWFPESFQKSLDIPESGSGMADILCECRYELHWLLKMQREDGGVFHKLTSMRHANFVMPCRDRRQMILFPVSSYATAAFAAVTALAARVFRSYDGAFSGSLLAASLKAWMWLEENVQIVDFHNPRGCNTGEYGDDSDTDERLWAAAELYRSTGDRSFLEKAENLKRQCGHEPGIGWRNVSGLAGFALLEDEIRDGKMTAEADGFYTESRLKQQYRIQFMKEAQKAFVLSKKSGYMAAMESEEFEWGSNMLLLTRGMYLAVAWKLCRKQEYLDTVIRQMDYLLGINASGYSYVSGIGEKSVQNIHNRITVSSGNSEIIPGYISGGANSRPVDEKAEWLIEPGTPPMKCFLDLWECYSLNEVTIYWNSPAVFLTAFLGSPELE